MDVSLITSSGTGEGLERRPGQHPESSTDFAAGDAVEVHCNKDGFSDSWYAASIRRRHLRGRGYFLVAYDSLLSGRSRYCCLTEVVASSRLRPPPPPSASGAAFRLHQLVDAAYNDGWWKGVVVDLESTAGRFRVCFPSTWETLVFEAKELRAHLDWVDGQWIQPTVPDSVNSIFNVGTPVEVARCENGIPYVWSVATIMKIISQNILMVEYKDLRNECGNDMLRDIVDLRFLRPVPPCRPYVQKYDVFDRVEAFHFSCWWPGVITTINEPLYAVKSIKWATPREFSYTELRAGYSWDGDSWAQLTEEELNIPCLQKKPKRKIDGRGASCSYARDGSSYPSQKSEDFDELMFPLQRDELITPNHVIIHPKKRKMDVTRSKLHQVKIFLSERITRSRSKTESPKYKDYPIVSNLRLPSLDNASYAILAFKEGEGTVSNWSKGTDEQSRDTKSRCFLRHVKYELSNGCWQPIVTCQRDEQAVGSVHHSQESFGEIMRYHRRASKAYKQTETTSLESSFNGTQLEQVEGIHCIEYQVELGSEDVVISDSGKIKGKCSVNLDSLDEGSSPFPVIPQKALIQFPPLSGGDLSSPCANEEQVSCGSFVEEPSNEYQPDSAFDGDQDSQCISESPQVHPADVSQNAAVQILPVCDLDKAALIAKEGHQVLLQAHAQDARNKNIFDGPISEKNKLPFVKRLHLWDTVKMMEVFSSMPQRPHFRPLLQYCEGFREGMAIGLMLTFASTAEEIRNLKILDSHASFSNRLSVLRQLETHGFDVQFLKGCLEELLKLKNDHERLTEKRSGLEGEVSKVLDEIDQLDIELGCIEDTVARTDCLVGYCNNVLTSILEKKSSFCASVAKLRVRIQEIQSAVLAKEDEFKVAAALHW